MSFQQPIWTHYKNGYNLKPNSKLSIIFTNLVKYESTLVFPNTNNDEIVNQTKIIADKIICEGKSWFASPIQLETFLRKVQHTFLRNELLIYEYGKTYIETWKLKSIWIFSSKFEIEWICIDNQPNEDSIIPSDFLNFSEEFNSIEPSRTIIIQTNDNELVEQNDIDFESSDQINESSSTSSRSLLKEKIKKVKVKLALAQLKISRLEKKYFRLYGFEYDNSSVSSNDESQSECE